MFNNLLKNQSCVNQIGEQRNRIAESILQILPLSNAYLNTPFVLFSIYLSLKKINKKQTNQKGNGDDKSERAPSLLFFY